jgi:nucleotide-binding universal stress UspA family protein
MPNTKRILIAVDSSGASRRTINYVADLLGGKFDFHVGLIHLELPPRMLEWGGSEDPQIEERVSSERAEAYGQLEKEAVMNGKAFLQRYKTFLVDRKIDVASVLVQFEEPLEPKNITEHILNTARERDYGTIVAGRHAFSGLKRLFLHHVADELVKRGEGFTVWVVE